jgi:hypothetical protein
MSAAEKDPEPTWWHREPDACTKQFVMGDDVSVDHFIYQGGCDEVLAELKQILRRELCRTGEFHLVRLRVDIELCA